MLLKHRLRNAYYNVCYIPYFIRISYGLLKEYWGVCEGDWSSIARILRYEIRHQRQAIERHKFVQNWERDCRQMQICEEALTRMLEDSAFERAAKRYPDHGPHWVKLIMEMERQDMETFLSQIKYLRHWWD